MAAFYLLQEDGSKIHLEDGSGSIILENSVPGPTIDWQAGGAGYPVRKKRKSDELFEAIEHSLEVALGLAEEPVEVTASAVVEEAAPAWSEERYRDAIAVLQERARHEDWLNRRLQRVQAMFRAYEEAQARERALQDDEETWFLMS